MEIAYRLKDNATFIGQVQKATLTTDNFGIEPTDGLFGSEAWWDRVASGKLRVHTLRGTIAERFMGSMGDWPEISVCSETGEESSWTRQVNNRGQDALYRVGRQIEIDYVLQRHRHKSSVPNAEHKVVLEIRVEPPLEGEAPGGYERVLAKEIARRVLTAPISLVFEASYELAELGRTDGVMSPEVHSVFVDARSEGDRLIGGRNDPEARKLEARWKERIFAACQKIVDERN
jgi:hypothetical protein